MFSFCVYSSTLDRKKRTWVAVATKFHVIQIAFPQFYSLLIYRCTGHHVTCVAIKEDDTFANNAQPTTLPSRWKGGRVRRSSSGYRLLPFHHPGGYSTPVNWTTIYRKAIAAYFALDHCRRIVPTPLTLAPAFWIQRLRPSLYRGQCSFLSRWLRGPNNKRKSREVFFMQDA